MNCPKFDASNITSKTSTHWPYISVYIHWYCIVHSDHSADSRSMSSLKLTMQTILSAIQVPHIWWRKALEEGLKTTKDFEPWQPFWLTIAVRARRKELSDCCILLHCFCAVGGSQNVNIISTQRRSDCPSRGFVDKYRNRLWVSSDSSRPRKLCMMLIGIGYLFPIAAIWAAFDYWKASDLRAARRIVDTGWADQGLAIPSSFFFADYLRLAMCFQSVTADLFARRLSLASCCGNGERVISAKSERTAKSMQVLFPDANVEFAVTALYQASNVTVWWHVVTIAGIHSRQGEPPQY